MTRTLLVSLFALVSLSGCCGSDYIQADAATPDRMATVEPVTAPAPTAAAGLGAEASLALAGRHSR